MTSSSPDQPTGASVLVRGAAAAAIPAARLDADLRSSRFVRDAGGAAHVDPRLVDPGLAAAFEEVAGTARIAAQAAGYAAGWAQGHAGATAHAREQAAAREAVRAEQDREQRHRVARALAALHAAADALERRAVVPAADIADELLAGALDLVEVIVGHELAVTTTPGLDAVRRALDLAPGGARVVVALHPQDRAAVAALVEAGDGDFGREVQLLADPSLAPGDALAECDATRIDARLPAALARVRAVLAP